MFCVLQKVRQSPTWVSKVQGRESGKERNARGQNSQKVYRFFTDFFTGGGRDGLIGLDSVGLAWTDLD